MRINDKIFYLVEEVLWKISRAFGNIGVVLLMTRTEKDDMNCALVQSKLRI